MESHEESAAELIRAASAAGYRVSRPQLARWHRRRLLPTPRTRGLGRGRGSETWYPPGSSAQLVALCEFRRARRNLDDVAWLLWWAGHDIPSSVTSAFMVRTAQEWQRRWAAVL